MRLPSSTARTASPPTAAGRNCPRNNATKYVLTSHQNGANMPFARIRMLQRHAITGTVATFTAIASATHFRSACDSVLQISRGSVNHRSATSSTAETTAPAATRVRRLIA